MADMLVLAFQTDSTRIATFVFANEGNNRPYPWLDISEGHHDLSHHEGKAEKQAKIAKINRFHVDQLAYLIDKLKHTKEGDGSLLDSCMISYGSGISDGNGHLHHNLPTLSVRPRRRHAVAGPPFALPRRNAAEQSLAGDAPAHGRPRRKARRLHRPAAFLDG